MTRNEQRPGGRSAFSLVEVALAIGVFAVAIVSILGLLAPAVDQARLVRLENAAAGLVQPLGDALRGLDRDNDAGTSAFQEVFTLVAGGPAWLYAFPTREGVTRLTEEAGLVTDTDGPVFAVRVSASGANPRSLRQSQGDHFTLAPADAAAYPKAWLALQVELFPVETPPPGTSLQVETAALTDPLATFHTAVLR